MTIKTLFEKTMVIALIALIVSIAGIGYLSYSISSVSEEFKVATTEVKKLSDRVEELSTKLDLIAEVVASELGISKEELLTKAEDIVEKIREEKMLIEKAKAEGRVVVYTSTDPRTAEVLKEAFERKYPFITVEFVRGGPEAMATRFIEEFDRGVAYADVLSLGTVNSRLMVLERPERLLVYVPRTAEWLTPELRDPEGRWHSDRIILVSLAYNTKLLKLEEAPKTFKDLIDPKWKGKIAYVDFRIMAFGVQLLAAMEKEYGEDFIKKLAAQDIFFVGRSFVDPVARVVSGEFLLTTPPITFVEVRKMEKDPIDWIRTADNVYFADLAWVGVASNAPHPNAAKLFVDFLFSDEGQAIYEKGGHSPLKPGVVFRNPDMSPKGKKIVFLEPLLGEKLKTYIERYAEMFFRR